MSRFNITTKFNDSTIALLLDLQHGSQTHLDKMSRYEETNQYKQSTTLFEYTGGTVGDNGDDNIRFPRFANKTTNSKYIPRGIN